MLCNLFSTQQKAAYSLWSYQMGGSSAVADSTEAHSCLNGLCVLPFLWKDNKDYSNLIDSLVVAGRYYEKQVNRHFKESKLLPGARLRTNDSITILYDGSINLKINACRFKCYKLLYNIGREFRNEDHYELFYLQDFGTIAAAHVQSIPSFEWAIYTLRDIKDHQGRTVLNDSLIKMIVDKAIDNVGN